MKHQLSSIFNDYLADKSKEANVQLLLSNCGALEADMVQILARNIEQIMIQRGEAKRVIRRMFNVIIESFQNIVRHGYESNIKEGAFMMYVEKGQYIVETFNGVRDEYITKVSESIDYINTLDKRELKNYYLTILEEGELSTKGGAGLGLITIALKTKNKIDKFFHSIGEEVSVFRMTYRMDSEIKADIDA